MAKLKIFAPGYMIYGFKKDLSSLFKDIKRL